MSFIPSINPTTGEQLGEFPVMSEFEVKAAVARARAAQPVWEAFGFKKRAVSLLKVRRVIYENMDEIAELVSRENGKPLIEAISQDVMLLMEFLTYFSKNAEKILKKEKIKLGKWALFGHKSHLEYQARGVVGVIGPWNYPVSNPFSPVVMGLIAGNSVILKPSEFTTLTGIKVTQMFHQAGIPKDVLQIVTGDGSTGAALIGSGVDQISFIGSVVTGKKIMAQAAQTLTPVTLELGGKDPFIVFEDANVDLASSAAVWGAFSNSGQVCASVERVYVHESIAEDFTKQVMEKTKKLKQGPGLSPGSDIGSMTASMQVDKVVSHVEEARQKGGEILLGGKVNKVLGERYFQPTVIRQVNHDFAVVKDETFGPVLPIMTFKTEQEVVGLANDSLYGLNAYVWTRNLARGERIASQIDAGTVNVNETLFSFGVPQTPWGGMKESGLGRTHGSIGLMDMVKVRHVYVNKKPSKSNSFWWFSYSQEKLEMVKGLCALLFGRGIERIKGLLSYLKNMRKVKTI